MSLTTALFTGLSGMDAHSRQLDVIGNNITNVNTIGYKANRGLFAPQLSQGLSLGTPPSGDSGGTNPSQVGLGVFFSGTQRNFNGGTIQPTGIATDLAMEGPGFFIVKQNGENLYTRAGNFDLNANNTLVSAATGGAVQGYGVDTNFNLVPGVLRDVTIPLGSLTIAEATRNVHIAGNLNADGDKQNIGSVTTSNQFYLLGTGTPVSATTNLIDSDTGGPVPPFQHNSILTFSGMEKGGKDMGTFRVQIRDPGSAVPLNAVNPDAVVTTFQDLADFLAQVLGIDATVPAGGNTPGVTISADGELTIVGNGGKANELFIEGGDILQTGTPVNQPFTLFNQPAVGESVRTTFVAYDSLGTPLAVDITIAFESTDTGGTNWRFYAESLDDTDIDRKLGTGVLHFDSKGQLDGIFQVNGLGALISVSAVSIAIDRANTGAITPLSFQLSFENKAGELTSLTSTRSSLAAVFQDGSAIGTLSSFSIGQDGSITGSFTNGLARIIGQIALGTFTNPEGLVDKGNNMYAAGPNSGSPIHVSAGTFGTGRIISGAVELSNVDLSQEFVNMINISTGFSASSRVITTSDELIQQLLAIAR